SGVVLAVTFIAIYRQLRLQHDAAAIEHVGAIYREWADERMTRAKPAGSGGGCSRRAHVLLASRRTTKASGSTSSGSPAFSRHSTVRRRSRRPTTPPISRS